MDLEKQERRLRERLHYYRSAIAQRPDGYVDLKLQKIIPRIDRALCKIREGSYGVCDDCGNKIPDDRLERVPAATTCLDCQAASEARRP